MSNKQTYSNVLHCASAFPPISSTVTPPTLPIPSREAEMQPNRGGGVGFIVTWQVQLHRFLILGSDKGYYTSAEQNTQESVKGIKQMMADGHSIEMCKYVKTVYLEGRAAKQDPIFVTLALLCTSDVVEIRQEAWKIVVSLRTFSHLCTFLKYYSSSNGGWGRLPRRSLNEWVTKHSGHDLLYQVFKYLNRDGWNLRDLLRCIHTDAKALSFDQQMALKIMILYGKKDVETPEAFNQTLKFAQENNVKPEDIEYLKAICYLKTCKEDTADVINGLVQRINHHRFTHEFLPKWALNNSEIWMALLMSEDKTHVKMPMNALIRNLSTMTNRNVFSNNAIVNKVTSYLINENAVKNSKIHPAQVAVAWKQYQSGHGEKGKQIWTPIQEIVTALENMMYISFANIEPTNKRIFHCFDESGSMNTSMGVAGNMSSAEAVALMGILFSRKEDPNTQKYCAFANGLRTLILSPNSKLAEAVKAINRNSGEGTNCSMPMEHKISEFNSKFSTLSDGDKQKFITAVKSGDTGKRDEILNALSIFLPEVFVLYTDSDVNLGKRHPVQALNEYRELTGIPAKFAVVATQSSRVTIADPKDSGMMDLVGFDSQLPQILYDFVTDKI